MTDHTPLTEQQLAAANTAAIRELERAFTTELNDDRALTLLDALIVLRSKLPCTCARSQGLHEQDCRRYVPGHDLLSPARRLVRAREELASTSDGAQRSGPKEDADTLPAWLYWRFTGPDAAAWRVLADDDRSYWEHQARAVRRAVARGGFKTTAPGNETAVTP